MHTEEKLGWFFGSAASVVAIGCFIIGVIDGANGWALIASGGWFLAGTGSIALGKERATHIDD